MKKHISALMVFVCMITIIPLSWGQHDAVMNQMAAIPQRIYQNPAFIPDGRMQIGIPGLSSVNVGLRSALSIDDMFGVRDDDSLFLDLNNIAKELNNGGLNSIDLHEEFLFFGMKFGKSYVNVSSRLTSSFNLSLPPDLITFLVKGNGYFLGETADIGGLYLNYNLYLEHAVGFNYEVTDKLRVGARAKWLTGIISMRTREFTLGLYTDSTDYGLKADSYLDFDLAFPFVAESIPIGSLDSGFTDAASFDFNELLSNHLNRGYGIDLGATFKLNETWTLNAALLDLGYIKWDKDVRNFHSDETSFTFTGIDLFEILGDSTLDAGDKFSEIGDSLANTFNLYTTATAFKNNLVPKLLIGASCSLSEGTILSGLIRTDIYNRRIAPVVSVSATKKLTNALTLSASYTARQRSYGNVGAGLSLNLGAFQFYLVTDYASNYFYLHKARSLQAHFGMNLTFGRRPKKTNDEPTDVAPVPAI